MPNASKSHYAHGAGNPKLAMIATLSPENQVQFLYVRVNSP